jgi:hypothetical protein
MQCAVIEFARNVDDDDDDDNDDNDNDDDDSDDLIFKFFVF